MASERPTILAVMIQSVQGALTRIAPPELRPGGALKASPIPRRKPAVLAESGFLADDTIARTTDEPEPSAKRETAEATDPPDLPGFETVARCGHANIVSKPAADGKARIYRASFSETLIDTFARQGCAQVLKGCNICSVRYEGCSAAVKAACTDAACLEEKCERKVICSAKTCSAQGAAPTCRSRLTQVKCVRQHFDEDGPTAPLTSGVKR